LCIVCIVTIDIPPVAIKAKPIIRIGIDKGQARINISEYPSVSAAMRPLRLRAVCIGRTVAVAMAINACHQRTRPPWGDKGMTKTGRPQVTLNIHTGLVSG
jgi:hypothetical protein